MIQATEPSSEQEKSLNRFSRGTFIDKFRSLLRGVLIPLTTPPLTRQGHKLLPTITTLDHSLTLAYSPTE